MEAPDLGSVFSRHLDFPRRGAAQLSADAFAGDLENRHGFGADRFEPLAWVERFFEVEHSAEALERELGWVQAAAGETVLRFDLGEFEYVVLEDEDEVVLVSNAGTMVVEKTERLAAALRSATLPSSRHVSPGAAFKPAGERAYFVGRSGTVSSVDPKLVAEALRSAPVRSEPLARVAMARSRLAPFSPTERPRPQAAPAPAQARQLAPAVQVARAAAGRTPPEVVVVERALARAETGSAARRWEQLAAVLSRGTPGAAQAMPSSVDAGRSEIAAANVGRETVAVRVGGVTALVHRPAAQPVESGVIARNAERLSGGAQPRWLAALLDERATEDGFWIRPGATATTASAVPVRTSTFRQAMAASAAAGRPMVVSGPGAPARAELRLEPAQAGEFAAISAPEAIETAEVEGIVPASGTVRTTGFAAAHPERSRGIVPVASVASTVVASGHPGRTRETPPERTRGVEQGRATVAVVPHAPAWAELALAGSEPARIRARREIAGELDPKVVAAVLPPQVRIAYAAAQASQNRSSVARSSIAGTQAGTVRSRTTGLGQGQSDEGAAVRPEFSRAMTSARRRPLTTADAMPATTLRALFTGIERTAQSAGYRVPAVTVLADEAPEAAPAITRGTAARPAIRGLEVEVARSRSALPATLADRAPETTSLLLAMPFRSDAGVSVGPELAERLDGLLAHRVSGSPTPASSIERAGRRAQAEPSYSIVARAENICWSTRTPRPARMTGVAAALQPVRGASVRPAAAASAVPFAAAGAAPSIGMAAQAVPDGPGVARESALPGIVQRSALPGNAHPALPGIAQPSGFAPDFGRIGPSAAPGTGLSTALGAGIPGLPVATAGVVAAAAPAALGATLPTRTAIAAPEAETVAPAGPSKTSYFPSEQRAGLPPPATVPGGERRTSYFPSEQRAGLPPPATVPAGERRTSYFPSEQRAGIPPLATVPAGEPRTSYFPSELHAGIASEPAVTPLVPAAESIGTRAPFAPAVAAGVGVAALAPVAAASLRWLPGEPRPAGAYPESPEGAWVEEPELAREVGFEGLNAEPGSVQWVLARAEEVRARSLPGRLAARMDWSVRPTERPRRQTPERFPSIFVAFQPRNGAGDWMLGDELSARPPPSLVSGVTPEAEPAEPVPGIVELAGTPARTLDGAPLPGATVEPPAAGTDASSRLVRGRYLGADGREQGVSIRLNPFMLQDVNARREPPVASGAEPEDGFDLDSQEIVIPVPLWMQMSEQTPGTVPAGRAAAPGTATSALMPKLSAEAPRAGVRAASTAPQALRDTAKPSAAAAIASALVSRSTAPGAGSAPAGGLSPRSGTGAVVAAGAAISGAPASEVVAPSPETTSQVAAGTAGTASAPAKAALPRVSAERALAGGYESDVGDAAFVTAPPAEAGDASPSTFSRASGSGTSATAAARDATAAPAGSAQSDRPSAAGASDTQAEPADAGRRGTKGGDAAAEPSERSDWPSVLTAEMRARPFARQFGTISPRGYLKFRWPAVARWWAGAVSDSGRFATLSTGATGTPEVVVAEASTEASSVPTGAAGAAPAGAKAGAGQSAAITAAAAATAGAPGAAATARMARVKSSAAALAKGGTEGTYGGGPSGALVEPGTAAAPREGETAFVAVGPGGESAVVGPQAASTMRRAKPGTSLDMTVVSAVAPKAPSLEEMVTGGERAHPKAKGKDAPARGSAKSDALSLQGTVDSLAQRVYHRLKRRLQSDRERFGG